MAKLRLELELALELGLGLGLGWGLDCTVYRMLCDVPDKAIPEFFDVHITTTNTIHLGHPFPLRIDQTLMH